MSNTALQFRSVSDMNRYLTEKSGLIGQSFVGLDERAIQMGIQTVLVGLRDAAMRNPRLLEVTPGSVLKSAMLCARMQLYPGGAAPDVYLIPRSVKSNNGWAKELQAQTSWRGLKKLIERAGVKNVRCRPVFQGEPFEVRDGTDGCYLQHQQMFGIDRDWDHLIACYVLGRQSGEVIHHVIGRKNIERHRESSDSYKGAMKRAGKKKTGPWFDHPVQMAMKTALIDSVSRGTFPVHDAVYEQGLYGEMTVERIVEPPARHVAVLPINKSSLGLDEDVEGVEPQVIEEKGGKAS